MRGTEAVSRAGSSSFSSVAIVVVVALGISASGFWRFVVEDIRSWGFRVLGFRGQWFRVLVFRGYDFMGIWELGCSGLIITIIVLGIAFVIPTFWIRNC